MEWEYMLRSLGRTLGLRQPLKMLFTHNRDTHAIVYSTHVEYQIPFLSSSEAPKNLVLWRCENGTLKLLFDLEKKDEFVPSYFHKAAPSYSVSCGLQGEVCENAQQSCPASQHLR